MTFEERLSVHGVDLSDLPLGYSLSAEKAKSISDIACRWFVDEDSPDGVALRNLVSIPLFQYILHLTDIIDRMETRIINLTGERDYLVERYGDVTPDCSDCTYDADTYCNNLQYECSFDFAGVPEDWSVDE